LLQFFLIKFWLVKFWIPGLDVAAAYDFLEGNKSPVSCLGILAKNIVMAIVLYIAGIVTFAKRDILRNENKWLNIILIICMIIMQRVVIQMSDYEVYQLPFASTLLFLTTQQVI